MNRHQLCPKCNWKLSIGRDQYGWFVECISCGYTRDLKEIKLKDQRLANSGLEITKIGVRK